MANPTTEFRQEVRFAVVMYGGVSLAIYINGIAQELLRLVRSTAEDPANPGQPLHPAQGGTEAVYRKIGQFLGREGQETAKDVEDGDPIRTRFVVDILSGTSAGGINGIFLAKALANDQNLDELKNLWVSEGDIEVLINDRDSVKNVAGLAAQDPPQALLNGQRMYRKLVAAFDGMETGKSKGTLADEIDLFVTTTDIRGLPLPLNLADGMVWENRHKNVFHFRYDRTGKRPVNDFAASKNPFLAFAARCTSSFPFAFEPFELGDIAELLPGDLPEEAGDWPEEFFPLYHLPTGAARPGDHRPHPKHAYDPHRRAFGDGGYLDNKPFSYAIDTLARRSSALPVDRKLIYVEPSPDHPEDQTENEIQRPNVLENVAAALSLARYETIREDLQRVLDRNRLIERVEHFLSGLEADYDWSGRKLNPTNNFSTSDLRNRIKDFGPSYGGYHRLKVAAVSDDIATWIARASRFDLESDQFLAIRYLVQAWRRMHFQPFLTEEKASGAEAGGSTENEFLKKLDLSYRLRRLRFVLKRIDQLTCLDRQAMRIMADRKQRRLPESDAEKGEFRSALATLRKGLNDALVDLREVEAQLESPGEKNPIAKVVAGLQINSTQILQWVKGEDDEGRMQVARNFIAGNTRLDQFADELEAILKPPVIKASKDCDQAMHPAAVPLAGSLTEQAYHLAQHYYYQFEVYDLISFPILYSTEVGDELDSVSVHRVSPEDATSLLDERRSGIRKLAGNALFHFGAFLDRGFRRNDILWGRLDGAERLIQILLPNDKEKCEALIREAHLEILKEEFKELDRNLLSDIVSRGWLLSSSTESYEKALRALAEKKIGDAGNPAFQAALRLALTGIDTAMLLDFYRTEFRAPSAVNAEMATRSMARSTQIVGHILEDLGHKYQKDGRPGAWIARLGGWFWGFVEVAVPRSIPNLLFHHWLKLLYFFEVFLIVAAAVFPNRNVQQLGWTLLGVTLLVNVVQVLLTEVIQGRTAWKRVLVTVASLVLLGLAVLGAMKVPETLCKLAPRVAGRLFSCQTEPSE